MKIAVVTPYDLAVPGGVNTHALLLSRWLRTAGQDVQFIGPSSSRNGANPPDTRVVARAHRVRAGGSVARIALSWRIAQTVRTLLRQERFDIVHMHEPLMPLLPLQFLRQSKAVNVGTFHAGERLGHRLYRLAGPLARSWSSRLDARIAVSRTAQALAEPYLGGPCEIIPNCVDVPTFMQPAEPLPNLRDGRRNILFVGRIEPRKGLAILLKAYARIRQKRTDTRLVVVGPTGSLGCRQQAWVRRQGWDDVLFTGAVSPADLPRYYQSADLFCAPALGGESFGLILAEAMAAGLPIVASDIAGYRNVVRPGAEAVVVPPGSPPALADALLYLLDHDAECHALGERGRERARLFSVDSVGQRVLALYNRLLQQRRRTA